MCGGVPNLPSFERDVGPERGRGPLATEELSADGWAVAISPDGMTATLVRESAPDERPVADVH